MEPDPHTTDAAFLGPLPPGHVDCPACKAEFGCRVCGGTGYVLDAVATAYDVLPAVDYSTAYTEPVSGYRVVVVPVAELPKLADCEADWLAIAAAPHLGLLVARIIPGHRVAVGAYRSGALRFVGSPELPFTTGASR